MALVLCPLRLSCALLCLVTCVQFASSSVAKTVPFERPKVLLLSVGGLRRDYLRRADCPILERFMKNGTTVKYVQNSINTASLVNHYSIATGLFPESHGIIASVMFDPSMKRVFKSDTQKDPDWWKHVHPVWKDNDKWGAGKSGVCRWPGVYGPMLPKLNCRGERESFKEDIDRVFGWFVEKDANLALIYVDSIKKAALKWGPKSSNVADELKEFDFLLGYLLRKIRDHNLKINILITSDHGVTKRRWNDVIDLDKCINPKSYVLLNSQGTLLFYPKNGHIVADVYKDLKKCHGMRVYLKDNLPTHYHYTHHVRIPPIVAFVPLGAVVRSSKSIHNKIDKILRGSPGISKDIGGNGYDPGFESMKSVFLANGPSFRNGLEFQAIHNTDIYGLVCHLLGIPPRTNNGSFNEVKEMLSESFSVATKTTPAYSDGSRRSTKRENVLFGDYETRALFWFLVGSSCLMFLICAIGCFHSLWKNVHHGYYNQTKVFPPTGKQLMNNCSSDED